MKRFSLLARLCSMALLLLAWLVLWIIIAPHQATAHTTTVHIPATASALATSTPSTVAHPTPTPTNTNSFGSFIKSINWSDPAIVVEFIVIIFAILVGSYGLISKVVVVGVKRWWQPRAEQKKLKQAEQTHQQKIAQHVQHYRDTLRRDDTIASIKILDMRKPIEVINVYVQMRVNQGSRANDLRDLEQFQRLNDPNWQ